MELFWYNIREMDDAAYSHGLSLLSAERRKQVAGLAMEQDRKRTVAGELLVRRALGGKMGVEPKDVPLMRDADGKPYVEDAPVYFSVSHSGLYVVCAVDERPIGVDVEVVRGAEEKFMRRVCTEREMAYVRLYDDGGYERFWEVWTAKEALFKLTGKGPLLGLSCFALPEYVALEHLRLHGCTVTAAICLK
ncbi:MAG: 4'-phosphopantetheinyl transferase superfamily protein [Eubacteriales bacterium]|nr:4'-phosphopantetheinyl transferase superfamily protein [Eubacteriales bacterium]